MCGVTKDQNAFTRRQTTICDQDSCVNNKNSSKQNNDAFRIKIIEHLAHIFIYSESKTNHYV